MEEKERNIQLFIEFLNKSLAGGRPVKKRFNTALPRMSAPGCGHSVPAPDDSAAISENVYRLK